MRKNFSFFLLPETRTNRELSTPKQSPIADFFQGYFGCVKKSFLSVVFSWILLGGILISLGGCASAASGPAFSQKAPASGKSQIVVYRPAEFGVPKKANILINGTKFCDMGPKGFAVIPVEPGRGCWTGAMSGRKDRANAQSGLPCGGISPRMSPRLPPPWPL